MLLKVVNPQVASSQNVIVDLDKYARNSLQNFQNQYLTIVICIGSGKNKWKEKSL